MKKSTTGNFELMRIIKNFKRILYGIGLGSLIFVLQSCGPHYVAEVPTGGVDIRSESPYAGAVWINGGWAWRGGHHAYTSGYWDHPRAGRSYTAGEWRHNEHGHYWVGGRWN
jgi:hypothetical protein